MTVKLKPQTCRLLAIRKRQGRPQLLSLDRHITQGGVSVRKMAWRGNDLALEGELELPRGEVFTAILYVPDGYELKAVEGQAKLAGKRRQIARLAVTGGSWRCTFSTMQQA